MPPKRIQNSIATGRQKSCTQCVKSKRRCDLQQPSCLRCTRQHLACSYPSRPPVQGFPSAAIDSAVPVTSPCQTGLSLDTTTYHSRQGIGLLDLDLNAGIGSLGFVHDILNTPTCGNQELSLPLTRSISVPINKQCLSQIVPETYERISYSIEQLKQGPATMVLEKQTPWSHPRLYEDHMPRILQDAHATCALYIARNNTNSAFFARHITDRMQDFIQSPSPTTPLELLARAHALILYQIMHVFSGDIRLNAQIDRIIPHFETSIYGLYASLQQDLDPPACSLSIYPARSAAQVWNSFILRESGQRTLMVLCQFLILLHLLQGRSYCAESAAVTSRITSSAHLWNAASTVEFAEAWNGKRHFLVEDLDYAEVLESAQPDDVDVFGRMILVSLMGKDDVQGWFHARGGSF